MHQSISKEQTPKDFAKEHWKETLAASAGISFVGLAIFLLIKYHKKRNKGEDNLDDDLHLKALEGEAKGRAPDIVKFLETGEEAKRYIQDSDKILAGLEKGLPKKGKAGKIRKALKTLRETK